MGAQQRGVALVVVLWSLVLLGSVTVSYAYTVRTEVRLARNQVELLRAEALAQGGIQRALAALANRHLNPDWAPEGARQRLTLEGEKLWWSVRNAAGRINLNTASAELLSRLFSAQGVAPGRGQRLVDALLDWRDDDDLRRLHGAETRDYRIAGRDYPVANGRFIDSAELLQVMGMDSTLYVQIEPFITVHGTHTGVNHRYAAPELLRHLSALDQVSMGRGLAADKTTTYSEVMGRDEPSTSAGGGPHSPYYYLTAGGRTRGGTQALIRVVVEQGTEAGEPFRIVEWRHLRTPQVGGEQHGLEQQG